MPVSLTEGRQRRILTTHVGSLPRPNGTDRPGGEDDAELRRMVADVVARQREIGIDVINEGEYTKGGDWLSYVDDRFGGFEARPPAGVATWFKLTSIGNVDPSFRSPTRCRPPPIRRGRGALK